MVRDRARLVLKQKTSLLRTPKIWRDALVAIGGEIDH